MPSETDAVALAVQLAASAGLVSLSILAHALGLLGIGRLLGLSKERLEDRKVDLRSLMLIVWTGLLLFTLHSVEILLFGLFYLAVGAVGSLEESLFHSAAAYATLGTLGELLPDQWRLMTASEALIGFLLIGWSTAFVVRLLNRLSDG
jgi:hypothetical protein